MGRSLNTIFSLGFALVGALLFQSQAYAWPPTYGSEFNFTSAAIKAAFLARKVAANGQGRWQAPGPEEREAVKAFADLVKQRCGDDCTVISKWGKHQSYEYAVTFTDGYSFNISVDPNCVEIQTPPQTLAELQTEANLAKTEAFIFSVAKDLKMTTDTQTAHFNIGILSAFENDPKGFLRFFVNYHNMPELASGALGKDYENAPPLSHLKPEQRAALNKIIDDVNKGDIRLTQTVASRIFNEVYTATPTFDSATQYQGVSVKYVKPWTSPRQDAPFELRSPRQPKTARERALLAEFYERRMAFEKRDQGPIAHIDVPKQNLYPLEVLANHFRLYVAEMADDPAHPEKDWEHFKELLPENLRNEPLDSFLSGKVTWYSWTQVADIKTYCPYLGNSAWARKRMMELLESPAAFKSGRGLEVLEAAKHSLGANADDEARKNLQEFIEHVQSKYAAFKAAPHSFDATTVDCVTTQVSDFVRQNTPIF